MSSGSGEQAVGTAAEEAAKLIASLTSWVGDHIATDAEECQLCPICLLIRSLRDANPEVVRHLAVAGFSLAAAAKAFLEGPAGGGGVVPDAAAGYGSTDRTNGSARIDITGEG
jgi:hypothetical protein